MFGHFGVRQKRDVQAFSPLVSIPDHHMEKAARVGGFGG
jgi:hypothetical protein